MAIGSVANFMFERGALKSAGGINAGLAGLQNTVANDERYQPAQFEAALRNFRSQAGLQDGRNAARRQRTIAPWLNSSRSRSSAAGRAVSPPPATRPSSASHVLLEATGHAADTIFKYQKASS